MAPRTIGILGSGMVGQALADGFLKQGERVIIGTREPAKLDAWRQRSEGRGQVDSFAQAARAGDTLVLAVPGRVAERFVRELDPALDGKLVIDATNPIAEGPPDHGVLRFFTDLDGSLMERLQLAAPRARWVKAFSCVGAAHMVAPRFAGGRPTMFICGDDDGAKREVTGILDRFGWDSADMGGVQAARAIEPLCMLWCIPGLRSNRWNHAFKLLQQG